MGLKWHVIDDDGSGTGGGDEMTPFRLAGPPGPVGPVVSHPAAFGSPRLALPVAFTAVPPPAPKWYLDTSLAPGFPPPFGYNYLGIALWVRTGAHTRALQHLFPLGTYIPGAVLDITAIINAPPLTLLPGVQRHLFITIPVIMAPTIPPPPYEQDTNTKFRNASAGFSLLQLPVWHFNNSFADFVVGPPLPPPIYPPPGGFPPDIFGPFSSGDAPLPIWGVSVLDYTTDHGTLYILYPPGPDN